MQTVRETHWKMLKPRPKHWHFHSLRYCWTETVKDSDLSLQKVKGKHLGFVRQILKHFDWH